MGMYSKVSEKIDIYNNLVLLYIMDNIEGEVKYTPPIKFQFTRHGYSCNNAANILSKEFEPSIHPFAIEHLDKTITHDSNGKLRFNTSDNDNDNEEKFEFETFEQPESQTKGIHVFVSPLIRTWETFMTVKFLMKVNPLLLLIVEGLFSFP